MTVTWKITAVSFSCICTATLIRYWTVFDIVPRSDLLEHFLTYAGLSILLTLIFLSMLVSGKKNPESFSLYFDSSYQLTRSSMNLYCSLLLALTSCVAMQWRWELKQAFVEVYGGAPRGYIQYEQLIFDLFGTLVGLCVLLLLFRKKPVTFH